MENLNKIYEQNLLFYWTNGSGDFNFPGFPMLKSPDISMMPKPVLDIVDKYWSEGAGVTEYVVSYKGRFGLMLGWVFSPESVNLATTLQEIIGKESSLPAAVGLQFHSCVKEAAEHLEEMHPAHHVLFGKDTDPEGDEILFFIDERYLTDRPQVDTLIQAVIQTVKGLYNSVETSMKAFISSRFEKREYEVGLRVEGRYYTKVKASSFEEARELAIDNYSDADFGELENIDCDVINAVDLETMKIYDYD